jgi:proline racemase
MTHASVIGSTFDGRIVSETTVGGRPAIVPAIRGSAWITGITQVLVDPDDPFPEGYLLADTWPGSDGQFEAGPRPITGSSPN